MPIVIAVSIAAATAFGSRYGLRRSSGIAS
jgi:hypothetical protein